MKKLIGFLLTTGAAVSLSACSWTLPQCNDELNECGRDSAYTEERTAKAGAKPKPAPIPEPVVIQAAPPPAPVPEPEPEPVAPPPPPPPVVDTQVMQDAEPMIEHISK